MQELLAADNCASSIGVFENTARAILRNGFARIIAACTRYEGKDAQRWAAECQLAAGKGEQFRQRAEAAEARVKELEASRAAAIAEAVSKRTVECDRVASEWMREHGTMDVWTGLHLAVIALNTPAPAYPFGKDAKGKQCECWQAHGEGWKDSDGGVWSLGGKIRHCPFCGAPRTKGE
jgi:hypothetical protein